MIIQCSNPNACLGSSDILKYANLQGNCSVGYYGNLCNNCQSNYAKLNGSSCSSCDDPGYYLIVVITSLIKIFLIVHTIRSTLKAVILQNLQKLQVRQAVYLKIIMNYFQLMTYTGNFDIRWPNTSSGSITFLAQFSFSLDLISVGCISTSIGIASDENIFYINTLITVMIPIILVLACCLLLILEFYQFSYLKKINNYLSSKKNCIISTLLVVLVYFNQTVLESAFSVFQCRNIYRYDQPEYYI